MIAKKIREFFSDDVTRGSGGPLDCYIENRISHRLGLGTKIPWQAARVFCFY